MAEELQFDENDKFDLIICNPPWLPENFVSGSTLSKFDLDLGVYDPNEQFLKSMMNFAKFHMDEKKGELLVIYSDFASNLGKQNPQRMQQLANQFGFSKIKMVSKVSMQVRKNAFDPLKNIKKKSFVQLWRISKWIN